MSKKRANGEGNIRKRKNGRWEGRYTAGYDPKTGKRINKNVLGKTQAEVREKPKTAMAECQGLDVSREADEHTVATWLKMWYELYAKPNVRTATANRYQLIIDTYTVPRIGNIKLKKMTTRHLQKLYKELLENGRIHVGKNQSKGLSTTTVRSVHLMLHAALDRAVKERLIPRNPCENCIVPKPRKLDMKVLSPEQMGGYFGSRTAARSALYVLSGTGQRIAEGRTGGPAVGRPGHSAENDFGKQAICPQSGRLPGTNPAQDRELRAAGVHPADRGGLTDPGALQAPGQPLHVPLTPHRRDVPPRLGGKPPQEDLEGCQTETP